MYNLATHTCPETQNDTQTYLHRHISKHDTEKDILIWIICLHDSKEPEFRRLT